MSLALAFDKVSACHAAYRLGFALSRILVKRAHDSQISWALCNSEVGHRGGHSVKPPSGCVYCLCVCVCARVCVHFSLLRERESIFELGQVFVLESVCVCRCVCVHTCLCDCKIKSEGKIHCIQGDCCFCLSLWGHFGYFRQVYPVTEGELTLLRDSLSYQPLSAGYYTCRRKTGREWKNKERLN